MSDSIGPESGLRQTVLRRFYLGTMILLPSHRLKQWGQLGENLGGVKFPWSGTASRRFRQLFIARKSSSESGLIHSSPDGFSLPGLQTEAPNWNMEKYIRKNSSYFSLSVVLLRLQKGGRTHVQSKQSYRRSVVRPVVL